jgi:hypothetical protein
MRIHGEGRKERKEKQIKNEKWKEMRDKERKTINSESWTRKKK